MNRRIPCRPTVGDRSPAREFVPPDMNSVSLRLSGAVVPITLDEGRRPSADARRTTASEHLDAGTSSTRHPVLQQGSDAA